MEGLNESTYNSFSPGQLVKVNLKFVDTHCFRDKIIVHLNIDVSVNIRRLQLDVLASDLLGLDLDQPDPLPPKTHRGVLHLLVDVVQVFGNRVVHHLGVGGGGG